MKTFKSQIAPVKMLAGIPVFIVYYMIILSCVQSYFGW
jgi:hypothetical protein